MSWTCAGLERGPACCSAIKQFYSLEVYYSRDLKRREAEPNQNIIDHTMFISISTIKPKISNGTVRRFCWISSGKIQCKVNTSGGLICLVIRDTRSTNCGCEKELYGLLIQDKCCPEYDCSLDHDASAP